MVYTETAQELRSLVVYYSDGDQFTANVLERAAKRIDELEDQADTLEQIRKAVCRLRKHEDGEWVTLEQSAVTRILKILENN